MSLNEKLMADMKDAMKSRDKSRLEVIRFLRSKVKNVEIDSGQSLDDDGVVQVLSKEAKRARDSIEQFTSLGQDDRVAELQNELGIIEEYLPQQLGEAEVAAIIEETIAAVGADSMKDMGKVMGAAMAKLKGVADGKLVQTIVRQKLNG